MSTENTSPTGGTAEPEPIKAVPVRHPWQIVAAVVVVLLVALFVYGAATNPTYGWSTFAKYLFDTRILAGVGYTLALTILAMVVGVVLGIILAVMRLSPNAVLKSVAWVYLWVFRGTPVYVQLVFWGLFPSIYKRIDVGIPFVVQFAHFNIQQLNAAFTFAVIGLALNESAYMAEIVRAGILSVGEGQTEASVALGMSWRQTMTRTVLPQAMRVIVPPTGNELISMLKTTSLVSAVPFTLEVYGQQNNISAVLYQPIPLLLVASTWYLIITSILMVGQYYLERYYARGASRKLTGRQLQALADAQAGLTTATKMAGEDAR